MILEFWNGKCDPRGKVADARGRRELCELSAGGSLRQRRLKVEALETERRRGGEGGKGGRDDTGKENGQN